MFLHERRTPCSYVGKGTAVALEDGPESNGYEPATSVDS